MLGASRAGHLTKVDEGLVFQASVGTDRQSATFPLACVTRSGRWWVAFRAAPTKLKNEGQHVLLTWSDDQGRSWHDPIEPFTSPQIDGKPGLLRFGGLTEVGEGRLIAVVNWVDHSNPELPYFDEATEALLDTRIFLSFSDDAGRTWSPLRVADTAPFNVPTPLTGPILMLPDGEWLCQFELNKAVGDPEPWKHASIFLFSKDEGRTWPRHTVAAQDPEGRVFYWDQRASVLPDGRLLDFFWTFDREKAVYLNIHARESRDAGRTWSDLSDTGVPGQPGPAFTLGDGALAMPYVDRTGAPAIRVRRSEDGGRHWPEDSVLTVYASQGVSQTREKQTMGDAWSEMYDFSVGLPHAARLPGGGALVVYYAGPKTDATGIRWAVVR